VGTDDSRNESVSQQASILCYLENGIVILIMDSLAEDVL